MQGESVRSTCAKLGSCHQLHLCCALLSHTSASHPCRTLAVYHLRNSEYQSTLLRLSRASLIIGCSTPARCTSRASPLIVKRVSITLGATAATERRYGRHRVGLREAMYQARHERAAEATSTSAMRAKMEDSTSVGSTAGCAMRAALGGTRACAVFAHHFAGAPRMQVAVHRLSVLLRRRRRR